MRDKIVVTGMGAVTPLGIGVDTYWNNLIKGECGIGSITRFDTEDLAVSIAAEVPAFNLEDYMPKKLIHQTDAFSQYAYVAAAEALGTQSPAEPERFGITLGTAMGGIVAAANTQDELTRTGRKNVSPRFVPRVLGNIAVAHIANAHHLHGPSMTVTTACASGNDAIALAASYLLNGTADAMLAVGCDSILTPIVVKSLTSAGALSRDNADPVHACRPFDENRNGFVIGEGGGALLLETLSHAEARHATIYGELAGWANNNDAYHITSPEPHGAYAAACMRSAIETASLSPCDIDYINAHGTATIAGDEAEALAITQVFETPDDASFHTPLVSSTKGATGHMMGAGGITEAIACIKAIQTGILPPSLNLDNPAFALNFITQEGIVQGNIKDVPTQQERHITALQPHEIKAAMSNAFGFGGQNSSLVFTSVN